MEHVRERMKEYMREYRAGKRRGGPYANRFPAPQGVGEPDKAESEGEDDIPELR